MSSLFHILSECFVISFIVKNEKLNWKDKTRP